MANNYNKLLTNLKKLGIPEPIDNEFFTLDGLKLYLTEALHKIGIPEEHVSVRDLPDFPRDLLGQYSHRYDFNNQHNIKINILKHFKFIYNSGEYSEEKVKELLKFTLLHCYGKVLFEYFTSKQFAALYDKFPLIVNQNEKILRLSFPTVNIMGTFFALYVLKKGKKITISQQDKMGICISQYIKLNFPVNEIMNVYLPREERILRKEIDILCSIVDVPLSPLQVIPNKTQVILKVAKFLSRKGYKISIIRGEGYLGDTNKFPNEYKDIGLNPFLLIHEAVLCNNSTIIDFCSSAYDENPILVGPKFKWKKLWDTLYISDELPQDNELSKISSLKSLNFNKR